jgi:hypothetical protein
MVRVMPFSCSQQQRFPVRRASTSHANAVKRFVPNCPCPFVAPATLHISSRRSVSCNAIESYMVDKLKSAELIFKELQLKMGDPEVAGGHPLLAVPLLRLMWNCLSLSCVHYVAIILSTITPTAPLHAWPAGSLHMPATSASSSQHGTKSTPASPASMAPNQHQLHRASMAPGCCYCTLLCHASQHAA